MKRLGLVLGLLVSVAAWAGSNPDAGVITDTVTSTRQVTLAYPHLSLTGTFGSGTVTCYYLDAFGAPRAVASAAFTSATDQTFDFSRPKTIYCTVSGSTGASINWSID